MIFGEVPVAEAEGAILAHSQRLNGGVVKKGTRLAAADIERLQAAGIETVIAARLDAGDVHEDAAAERIARAAAGEAVAVEPPFTGRANLAATTAGVLVVDQAAIDAANRIDPAVTIATLDNYRRVEPGRMIATAKIIPFAAPEAAVAEAERILGAAGGAIRVAPFRAKRVAAISTMLDTLKPKTVDKTLRILAQRLEGTGAALVADIRVPHTTGALADALRQALADRPDVVIVFGASAIVDRHDVIPAAIDAAGGAVDHFGMPVDPGNLLLIGGLDGARLIGAPGCARSPKENGFDWVLDRFLAGLPVTPHDITGMGVGGLLMEIVSRPQPRREALPDHPEPKIAAIVLAAGRSSRMGGPNKMLEPVGGRPLVRHAVDAATASRADPVLVVTGNDAEEVAAAVAENGARTVHNPRFAEGLSTSLATGLAALPEEIDGAMILLGDMPGITAAEIDRMIAAYAPPRGSLIVVATAAGKRGNPVLWDRRFFADLMAITGDTGGRALFDAFPDAIVEVELGDAARLDIDTPEALAALRQPG